VGKEGRISTGDLNRRRVGSCSQCEEASEGLHVELTREELSWIERNLRGIEQIEVAWLGIYGCALLTVPVHPELHLPSNYRSPLTATGNHSLTRPSQTE
jgi:hypothetical protein